MSTQPSAVTSGDVIQRILLDRIIPSKDNARKAGLDDKSLTDLACSIKTNGVIVPIKLRQVGERFRIIYGERRWRASLIALADKPTDEQSIPATVHQMTDEQEQEERAIENLQREDLAPMEEAHEFQRLLGKTNDVAGLAARLGKEESYIARRMKLLAMIPEAQKALASGHIQLGHAQELCRLNSEDQKRVLKFLQGEVQVNVGGKGQYDWENLKATVSVEGLRTFIQTKLMADLSRAKFNLKDPDLNPKMGPCTSCPHNTANTAALFADLKTARCTQPECFFGKEAKALDIQLADLAKERGVEKLYRLSDHGDPHDNRGLGSVKVDGYYQAYSDDIALVSAGKECKYTIPAVVVHVNDDRRRQPGAKVLKVGDETLVCVDEKCKEHHALGSSGVRKVPLKGLALVNKKETNLSASRKQRARLEAFRRVCEKAKGSEFGAGEKSVQQQALTTVLLPYVEGHLFSDRWRDAGKALGLEKPKTDSSGKSWHASVTKYFEGNDWALAICIVMMEDIPENSWHKGPKGAITTMAALYKIDLAEITSELKKADAAVIHAARERAKENAAKAPKKAKAAKVPKAAKPKAEKKAKAKKN